jgi:hypothetical protein
VTQGSRDVGLIVEPGTDEYEKNAAAQRDDFGLFGTRNTGNKIYQTAVDSTRTDVKKG